VRHSHPFYNAKTAVTDVVGADLIEAKTFLFECNMRMVNNGSAENMKLRNGVPKQMVEYVITYPTV
jgi:hypothetical protein